MGTPAQNKYGKSEADAGANAAFIVRACNNHDALLEALRGLLGADVYMDGEGTCAVEFCADNDAIIAARAAIAAATDAAQGETK